MKTTEFKLSVTHEQELLIQEWLISLKRVWNKGLELLLEHEQIKWRGKKPECPTGLVLKWSAKKFESVGDDGKVKTRWGKRRLTGSGVRKTKAGHLFCPIRRRLPGDQDPYDLFNSGSYYNDTQMPGLAMYPSKIPVSSRFRTGTHKSLWESWKAYTDPNHPGRRPKFKGRLDSLKSLLNLNAGAKYKELKPIGIPGTNNGYVSFPKLGQLHVKGLFKRFDASQPWGNARILVEPSGYYLQVVVPCEAKPLKPNDKQVGIDPGVKAVVAFDDGRLVAPGKFLAKRAKRIKRLQRKLSRQELALEKRRKASLEKLEPSKSYRKTQKLLALCHEKVRRSRSAFNHKLSTKIVREYGAIAFEDTQLQNMTRKPKAKKREDGTGYAPNNARAKAGLNRSLLDVAIGDLRAKIKTKAESSGRAYDQTEAKYSSQTCHCCHEKGDRQSQSEFICLNVSCSLHGVIQNADVNAARNHLQNASFWATGKYRAWAWELKREARVINSPSSGITSNGETLSHSGAPEAEQSAPRRELSSPISAPWGREPIATENLKPEYPLKPLSRKGHKRRIQRSTRDTGGTQLSLDFDLLNSAGGVQD